MTYDTMIDGETWAFIRETEAYYPPETTQMGIDEQRRIYDRMCRAFFRGYPQGVSVRDARVDHIALRIYEAKNVLGTVVYFHGGGFVVGGLESHDDICAELCDRTGLRVVSVDYRLCPEHSHPAAFQDAVKAVEYVSLTWPGVTILAGDSAGGNLAAAAAHDLRGAKRFSGQVLIYPGLGGDMKEGSYLRHANAPLLSLEEIKYYHALRHGGDGAAIDATSAPLVDRDFSDLPPTIVFSAECDPLSDDGKAYCERIVAAGGQAYWVKEQGLVHGYLRARYSVGRARESFSRIVFAIRSLAE